MFSRDSKSLCFFHSGPLRVDVNGRMVATQRDAESGRRGASLHHTGLTVSDPLMPRVY